MVKRNALLTSLVLCGFVFDILPISMIFKAGHSIRLVINFADARTTPKLDPAPRVAIYRDSTHRSYVPLPIIEAR